MHLLTDETHPCTEKNHLPPSALLATAIFCTKFSIVLFFFSFFSNFALTCAGFGGLPAAGKPSPPSHMKSQTSSVASHFYQGNGCDRALLGVANQAWLFVAALHSEAIAVRLCHVKRLKATSEMVASFKHRQKMIN